MVKQDSSCGRSGSHGKNDKKKLRSINQRRILMTWNATIVMRWGIININVSMSEVES